LIFVILKGEYTLKKNTEVIAFPHLIHYDEKNYTNPEIFDPDRFLSSNSKKRHPCSFVPFSTGRRNCIGERFSLIQLKIFLAHILHNFDIESQRVGKDFKRTIDFDVNSTNESVTLELTKRLKY